MSGFLGSTVGKKYLMGITGLIWAGFVLAHMAGNLLIFVSHDAYNSYGHALTSGNIIYVAETVLVLALIVHVYTAISLTISNRTAKDQRYAVSAGGKKKVSLASRTMAIQGSLILVFIILHIITFKYGTYYSTTVKGVEMRDLAKLMAEVFQSPGYVAWYVVCLILLGFHLSHGVGSTFQSLGLMEGTYRNTWKKLSYAYAVIVALGFIAQPTYLFLIAQ
ncbi:succinate dehydrogenase cytochrome b subunit [Bdellovibrio svalbardensis]|uniref:Succinate dehydrogenase cytochrome b subunit n=1 Tax=Bdellovibrio svalbardensis TaxID=2972972 RepID=A0ABT6DF51_9BACT|nr:succinate dehydrogenase cytochrome b subunit [Bdellovibrio svalbardensis]MDG0814910.1 succinate dehydrogenase cytochrome b subunit [Bdellovibrio svalbardensis]